MGSQLGSVRTHGLPPDLLWLDPTDIVRGRLSELRWGANPRLRPLGGIAYSYLGLKLRLQARGFDVTVYDYDWRDGSAHARRCAGGTAAGRRQPPAGTGRTQHGRPAGTSRTRSLRRRRGHVRAHRARHWSRDAARRRDRGSAGAARHLSGGIPARGSRSPPRCPAFEPPRLRHLRQPLSTVAGRGGRNRAVRSARRGRAAACGRIRHSSRPRAAGARTSHRPMGALSRSSAPGNARSPACERLGGQFRYEVSTAGDGTVAVARATLPGAHNYYLKL